MNNIRIAIATHKWILLVCVLFFLVRLIGIENDYLLHDERDIALTGYAIAHTGRDLSGVLLPLNFANTNPNSPPIPYYLSALWWLFGWNLSVASVRLPFIIVTSTIPLWTYLLTKQITTNRRLGYIVAIVHSFSPWILHTSRMALDSPIALTATLAGLAAIAYKRNWVGIILLLLASFTYQGYRVVIPPLLLASPFVFRTADQSKSKLVFIFATIVLIGSTLVLNSSTIGMRVGDELLLQKLSKYDNEVIEERTRTHINPVISAVFSNRYEKLLGDIGERLLRVLDVRHLFWTGDYTVTGSTFTGAFWYGLAPFFIFGLCMLQRQKPQFLRLIAASLFIGILPVMMHKNDVSFAFRGTFMAFGYAAIISLGIYESMQYSTQCQKFTRFVLYASFSIFFFLTALHSMYTYWVMRPAQISEFFFESERSVAKSILREGTRKVVVYDSMPVNISLAVQIQSGMVSPNFITTSLRVPTSHNVDSIQYEVCQGNAWEYLNTHVTMIRYIARNCTDDALAQKLFESYGDSAITYTSDWTHQPIYYRIPPNAHLSK
jgi:hypothetical protein